MTVFLGALRFAGFALLGIICALAALLVITLLLPVRVRVEWHKTVRAHAGLGPFMLSIWPQKAKKTRKKPVSPPKSSAQRPKKRKPAFRLAKLTPQLALEYARLAKTALGQMARAVKISEMKLHAVVADSDPGKAAMTYGGAAAAISSILPLFEKNIKWSATDVLVEVDFDGEAGVDLDVCVRAMAGVLLFAALRGFRGFLKINSAAIKAESTIDNTKVIDKSAN